MDPFRKTNEQGIVLTPMKRLITRIISPFFKLRDSVDLIWILMSDRHLLSPSNSVITLTIR
jgi:hypothetical protein